MVCSQMREVIVFDFSFCFALQGMRGLMALWACVVNGRFSHHRLNQQALKELCLQILRLQKRSTSQELVSIMNWHNGSSKICPLFAIIQRDF